jgi:hypothetical protein
MGCNAGLNGMLAERLARQNPAHGVMICCEITTATYSPDDTARDGIVNSLSATAPPRASRDDGNKELDGKGEGAHLLDYRAGGARDALDWHRATTFHFFLSRTSYISAYAGTPVQRCSRPAGSEGRRRAPGHTGGGSVIDAIKMKLNLMSTTSATPRSRDYGTFRAAVS